MGVGEIISGRGLVIVALAQLLSGGAMLLICVKIVVSAMGFLGQVGVILALDMSG